MLETGLDLSKFQDVDWARLAFPQADGYDTDVLQRIAFNRWGWRLWDVPEDTPTWLHGRVPIEVDSSYGQRWDLDMMQPDNPRWKQTAELAMAWPAQYYQFRCLINGVRAWYPPHGTVGGGCSCGSMSGNPFLPTTPLDYPKEWGRVWATCTSTTGYLEGIVHELAHWKGYALGVYIEDWEHLIFSNVPPSVEDMKAAPMLGKLSEEEHQCWVEKGLGFQPLRVQMLRPIGALFQEIWCCVHMIAYHLKIFPRIQLGEVPNDQALGDWLAWVTQHVKRTWCGQKDMIAIAQPTPDIGEAFWRGYTEWTQRLVEEACTTYGIEDVNDYHAPVYD